MRWLLLTVLFIAVAVPADATHVTEPAVPIGDLQVHLIHYATQTPIGCGDKIAFGQVRLWATVASSTAPSEHWTTRIVVTRDGAVVRTPKYEHQNIPPHGLNDRWTFWREEIRTEPGVWDYEFTLTGDASGKTLVGSCGFVR